MRARDPSGLAERAPSSCAPPGSTLPRPRAARFTPPANAALCEPLGPACAGPADPPARATRDPIPAHAGQASFFLRAQRGLSILIAACAGQPSPGHARREAPLFRPRRRGTSPPFMRARGLPPPTARAPISGRLVRPTPSCERGAGGASLHFLPARCGASPPVPERAGSAHPPVPATRAPSASCPCGAARATLFLRDLGSPATWGTSPTFCARGAVLVPRFLRPRCQVYSWHEPHFPAYAARGGRPTPFLRAPGQPSYRPARRETTPQLLRTRRRARPHFLRAWCCTRPRVSARAAPAPPFLGTRASHTLGTRGASPPSCPHGAERNTASWGRGASRSFLPRAGAPRDWCPSPHRKGSPVEGRVSSTA